MTEIKMPSLGADMDKGTLVEWKVHVGDHVTHGQIVGLIETRKATMELESFAEGDVDALLVEPGTDVAVGTVLARLRAPGAAAAAVREAAPAAPAPAPHVRSSPAARQRARELGIPLASLHGTGPHGAIVLRDVVARPPAAPPAGRRLTPTRGPIRDAIAAAMARSKREIPHYYLAQTIDLGRALAWLADANAHRPIQDRILPGALLLRAVAVALWEVPELNGFWTDGAFQPVEEVHLGTAIALRTGGLIAPALLDADDKPLDQLMAELHDLVARTRAGRLRSAELTSATITVTSLGDRGCDAVWPVINPPQVAIVGFGAITERPWVVDGAVVARPTIIATLAADHRVSDGHRGGIFLSTIDHLLQGPDKL